MKKLLAFATILLFISCSKDKFNNTNPNLPNYSFSMLVDMNLPLYASLANPGNAIKVYPANGPSKGVIVFNTGSGYKAYDGSCPNQAISSCSALTYTSSNAVCGCDSASYNLFTGLAAGQQYPLKEYRVEITSTTSVRVYN